MVVSRGFAGAEGEGDADDVVRVGGIEEGLRRLRERFFVGSEAGTSGMEEEEEEGIEGGCRGGGEGGGEGKGGGEAKDAVVRLGRVFVIGGADIYRLALGMECCERILWTRVGGEWECDVFFPAGVLPVEGDEDVGGDGGESGCEGEWVRRSTEEMERWVGEGGVGGVRREGEVEFEVCMFERVGRGMRET